MKNRNPRARPAVTATGKRADTLSKLGKDIAELRARLADLAKDRAKDPPKKSPRKS